MGIIYRDRMILFMMRRRYLWSAGNRIRETVDDVAFLAALPMVHEALEKIVEAFPGFSVLSSKGIECPLLSGQNDCG